VLLASVVVHAVVLGVVRLEWDAWIPPVVTVPVTPHVEVVDVSVQPAPAWIDVAMLDESSPPRDAPVRSASSRISSHAIASSAGNSTGTAAPEPGRGHGTGAGKGMFEMRGPELHPGDAAMEHIADAPGHEPVAVIPSGRVDSAPGGRAVIHDEVTTITVDRDGTAHLHDKADGDIHISVNPLAIISNVKAVGTSIADWAKDPEAGTRYGRTQDLSRANQASPGGCTWGDPMCDDPDAPEADKAARARGGPGQATIFGLAGKADITSYLMRKLGVGDAYSARKMKALDDTRLERAERGAKYKTEQLGRAAVIMQENLQRVWSGTVDVDERKAVVFELWDECAEGDGPIGDAGEKARVMVIGWIRAYLPDGKPGAFTAQELDLLDRRRTSKQHFAPY
jgi:hypothetical protein